jgi:8-oxo-dGTP diphosphatase
MGLFSLVLASWQILLYVATQEQAMPPASQSKSPVPGVGVVCLRGDQVLLIQRGKPPREGEWSLPGGRIEWGERAVVAALRELKEETGVDAELVGLIDVVDGVFESRQSGDIWAHYVLVDYAARWVSGEPVAGDDARAARFVPLSELHQVELWSETRRIIEEGARMVGP